MVNNGQRWSVTVEGTERGYMSAHADEIMRQARSGELTKAMGVLIAKSCEPNEALGLKPCKAEIEATIAMGHTVPAKYLQCLDEQTNAPALPRT